MRFSQEQVEDLPAFDTSIVTIDENGQAQSAGDIKEALDRAQAQIGESPLERAGAKKNVVVVLDPGHDGTHLGAHSGNLQEEELVLKIAQYCKAELSTYSGVKVYMTRDSALCPHPGTTSVVCNSNRVAYAKSVGATVYVSIHLNSAAASANGAEVYYPNSSYNAEIGSKGKSLAESILKKLVGLGLYDRGVKVRNSGDGSLYPDGSLADYYGVIKNSKLNGFPGIIIEHAFMTNPSDAQLLSSEEGLKSLGEADAQGIAEYFSLKKGEDNSSFSAGKIVISDVDTISGKFAVSIGNVEPKEDVEKVQFKVYPQNKEVSSKVYNTKELADGSYKATVYASKHDYQEGTYVIEAYAVDEDGESGMLGETTLELIPNFKATLSASVSGTNNISYQLSAKGISDAESVRFLFYYKKDGKTKGVYYKGKKGKDGVWTAKVPLKKMINEGSYKAYVYATAPYGTEKQAGSKVFEYTRDMAIQVKAKNSKQSKFRVTAGGLAYATSVEYEVYSKIGGKDDLIKYKASKNADGAWIYDVPVSKHKTEGKYYVTAYATIGTKRLQVGKKTFTVSGPTDAKLTVSQNSVKAQMQLSIKNLDSVSGIN